MFIAPSLTRIRPRYRPPLLRKQRQTAEEQRAVSLFYRSPHLSRPRISAENAIPCADNFRQKQQKQREPQPAAHLCILVRPQIEGECPCPTDCRPPLPSWVRSTSPTTVPRWSGG